MRARRLEFVNASGTVSQSLHKGMYIFLSDVHVQEVHFSPCAIYIFKSHLHVHELHAYS